MTSAFHTQNFQRYLRHRMAARRPTHNAYRQRHFQPSIQQRTGHRVAQVRRQIGSVLDQTPIGEGPVLPLAGSVGMPTGLDRTPIVSRCQQDSVNAIENAFVVRCSAIGIGHSEGIGLDDSLGYGLPRLIGCAKRADGDRDLGPGAAFVGQIAKNTQQRPPHSAVQGAAQWFPPPC